MIGRLIRVILGALVLTSIGGAIVALIVKQRLPSEGTAESDEIALVTIFGPLEFESRAEDFRGGTLTCLYGGGDIDLREATLDPAGAELEVRIAFGGGRLLVPEDWDVGVNVVAIVGGIGDMRETRVRPADAPKLTITGFVLFGGLGIDTSKREAELVESNEGTADHTNGADPSMSQSDTELIPALDV
jgi:hypothetical protein